jgi:hypothetical protein
VTISNFAKIYTDMWYYLDQTQQQQGPVEDNQPLALQSNGTINSQTLIWRDGLANWIPLSQSTLLVAPSAAVSAAATCDICHKPVGADNLIELSRFKVCAVCKPTVVQSLREGVPIDADLVWRDGKKMVAKDGARFPARCIKCNQPVSNPPLKRKLYWHNPFIYLFIFLHIIIYVIIAVIVRKKGSVEVYMCNEHLKRRMFFIAGAWLAAVVGMVVGTVGIAASYTWIGVLGFVFAIIGAPTIGIVWGKAVSTRKIKDKTIWLGGGGKEFLASLPEWDGKVE